MKRAIGIGGIFFRSKDPAALGAWYNQHLGIPMESWGGSILFWDEPQPDPRPCTIWSPFPQDTQYFAPSHSSFMINFRVADLEALLEALKEEGVVVFPETMADENGKFGWILDPEGNKVELWEPPVERK